MPRDTHSTNVRSGGPTASFRARWARRIILGAVVGFGAFSLTSACISGKAGNGTSSDDPLSDARGAVEGLSTAPRATGPVAFARCGDVSNARFELERTGSTHILTGLFVSPDDGSPRAVTAEFHHAEGDSDAGAEGGVRLAGLRGSVAFAANDELGARTSEEIPSSRAQSLSVVTLSGVDEPNGGRIALQYDKTLLELSGCQFNLAALKRVRGQEHVPIVAFLRR